MAQKEVVNDMEKGPARQLRGMRGTRLTRPRWRMCLRRYAAATSAGARWTAVGGAHGCGAGLAGRHGARALQAGKAHAARLIGASRMRALLLRGTRPRQYSIGKAWGYYKYSICLGAFGSRSLTTLNHRTPNFTNTGENFINNLNNC
ncbi:hypothetical protein STAS_19660 [Striga asiatica]|uniref:Uncharacterized protein n=1 Tax=Striga asiatica TaxID=4170 RepID=A0A5A7QC64_STRAF|nr:hypothetical protein STAS_19660 [Striga asiatica]